MAVRTALLLLNPGARRAGGGRVELADALRQRGLTVIPQRLDDPDGVARIVARRVGSVDRVIVGGGDGTLGSATGPLLDAGLPLGILPLGTANNLARTLGIPEDVDTACDIAAGDERRRIDVGEVNGRCFLTAASFGLSVAITETLSSEAKRRWGALAYVLAAARAVRKARPVRAHIRWDGGELHTRTVQVVVGNGRYYGSALRVAEDARIDDHALDLYSIEVRHWWRLFTLGPDVKLGRHGRRRAVKTARARAFEITTPFPCPIDVDGELVTRTPATFRVLPDALEVFVSHARDSGA
jgi:YegS/Rv2252/BmrU family lipid kinase